jgi:hypothetical protein
MKLFSKKTALLVKLPFVLYLVLCKFLMNPDFLFPSSIATYAHMLAGQGINDAQAEVSRMW